MLPILARVTPLPLGTMTKEDWHQGIGPMATDRLALAHRIEIRDDHPHPGPFLYGHKADLEILLISRILLKIVIT